MDKITGEEFGIDWWGNEDDWWGNSPPVNMLKNALINALFIIKL